MSEAQAKRKQGPGAPRGGSEYKKRKEGSAGRWKTPVHRARHAEMVETGTALNVNDEGIWVTYARGMRTKAMREFKELCDEYGERMYGIRATGEENELEGGQGGLAEADVDVDIESSIQQELSIMKAPRKPGPRQTFTPVSVGIECVFFMKTMKPVEPDAMIRKICEDAAECPDPRQRKCRYVNRLTPVFDTDKATDNGILRVARTVLAPWFGLNNASEDVEKASKPANQADTAEGDGSAVTYAIRHNIRNHTVFKSETVIKMIASMINPKHKVNLTNPDKVILVEIFQLFCGISVVDGKEWEQLKRYNINGLYGMTSEQKSGNSSKP